ncbi:MAG: radical SAM protein [Candidatus Eisenbacteria bacterium]
MSQKRKAYELLNQTLLHFPPPLRSLALSSLARVPWEKRLPSFLMVEPTNGCTLRCPLCPVGAQTTTRAPGFLDVDAYTRLLEELRTHVTRILMNFAGEPLLHPRIADLIAATRNAGIQIDIGTHGNIDKMQEIVDAGVSSVLFALDGASQQVYETYRRRGRVDKAIRNLEKLMEARRRLGGGGPEVTLQMVVMKHNLHEAAQIVQIGADMGVDAVLLRPVCVNDFFEEDSRDLKTTWVPPESLVAALGLDRSGWRSKRPVLCDWFTQCVILFNGDVTVCCYDTDGKHVSGNAFEEGFEAVWRGRRLAEGRRGVVHQSLEVCSGCDINLLQPVVFDPRNPPAGVIAALEGVRQAPARVVAPRRPVLDMP